MDGARVDEDLLRLHRWLLGEGLGGAGPVAVGNEMCRRLVELGVPLDRGHVLALMLHPLYHGRSFHWRPESGAWSQDHPHGLQHLDGWKRSVFKALVDGDLPKVVRFDLRDPQAGSEYPLFDELRAEGITEYLAVRLTYSNGMNQAMSFATRDPDGFSAHHVAVLAGLERIMAVRLESAMRRDLGQVVLATYLGEDPARRVLAGNIRRGDVETIHAVIWMSDLRDFTQLSETLSPDALIALLSDYFECMVDTVRGHGGEVLKFVGDAVLAIFRTSEGPPLAACEQAMQAARRAMQSVDAIVRNRQSRGEAGFDFGVGLHVGDVIYGNVGARDRLDFTVIGAAVNLAARIEGLCGPLERRVLVSQEFAAQVSEELEDMGEYDLKGVGGPVRVYALTADGPERFPYRTLG